MVQPPLGNHRDFNFWPTIDGIRIQGLAGYGVSFSQRCAISDRLEVVHDGSIVRRALRFKKLEWTEGEKPDKRSSADELGTIEVKLGLGTLGPSSNHHPHVSKPPRPTIAEKVKKVCVIVGAWLMRKVRLTSGKVLGPYEYNHLVRLHPDPHTPICSVKFTYATSNVVSALLKEAKESTRNRAGYRNATCSPFEDDEVTLLEFRPPVKRERSSSTLSTAPESSAEGSTGDEKGKRRSKKQRLEKETTSTSNGTSTSGEVSRDKGKVGPRRGKNGRFVRSR
ncbi:hypothetical protein A1Q2_06752 [Trichosporon asahii var. asahii CBS 8904]|uniref:Uncharacterized protein n=1 Tax=Trichosporon asahii var. asahii (strain CBS 8904) TaxID=1220162 RepID=K1WBE8_TRIAC|nr:hypothetical protein A1Q2_06752 [Trichosporon asahii var. asahii CBS 8904]